MPAAKLRPVGPSTTTVPPVMYSQPWSPTPSTTATAPELRTANRSPDPSAQEQLAAGRAVQDRVAGDDLLLGRRTARASSGPHDQPPAGQALADVVVGVAEQPQRHPARHERAERLPGACRAASIVDRVVGQARRRRTGGPPRRRASRRRCGARCAPRTRARTGVPRVQRRRRRRDQLVVQRPLQPVVLLAWSAAGPRRRAISGTCSSGDRSSPCAFQWSTAGRTSSSSACPIASSSVRKPELGQVPAHLLGQEQEEVLHELRLAGEPLAQHRVLGGDADRAGVEVADPHHDAARRRSAARWRSRTPRRRAAPR